MDRRDFLKSMSIAAAAALLPTKIIADSSFRVDTSLADFDMDSYQQNSPQVILVFLSGGASELAGNLSNIEEIDNMSVYKYDFSKSSITEHNFWLQAGGAEMERMLASGDMNLFRTCYRLPENDLRSHGINTAENKRAINDHKNINAHPTILATLGKILADNGAVDENSIMPFIEINGETNFFEDGEYLTTPSFVKPIAISASLDNPFKEKKYNYIDQSQLDELSEMANSVNRDDFFAQGLKNAKIASDFIDRIKDIEAPEEAGYSRYSTFAQGLKTSMNILINNPDTKCIAIGGAGLGRWDDHSAGFSTYRPRMHDVMSGIEAAVKHMNIAKKDNISIWVFAEFGRNVNLNSANGWDHGNNQNLYIFGGNRYFNHLGIVGETTPYGDAKANRLYLKPKDGSYFFEPYSIGATLYKIFGIKNPEVLTGGYKEIEANLLKSTQEYYNPADVAVKLSDYDISDDATANSDMIAQAIADTPEGKILLIDRDGVATVDSKIVVDKAISIIVKNRGGFTIQLTQKSDSVLYINSQNVTIKGLNVDGNSKTNIGIYSNYANLTIDSCKVYNILYDNLDVSDVCWGIGIVPQSHSGDSGHITINSCEVYNVESKLYDDRRGTYGLARAIRADFMHLRDKSIECKITKNYTHDIISEEDDHIVVLDDGSSQRADKNYKHHITIEDNRCVGFTRRAIKAMTPNAKVHKNYCESAEDFDTTKHPAFTGIDIMGVNSEITSNTITVSKEFESAVWATQENATISNNHIILKGGIRSQYMCYVAYNAINYLVENNTLTLDGATEDSYFFYIKGNSKGKILDNEFFMNNTQTGRIKALVYQTVYKDEVIKNDMIYRGSNIHDSVLEAVYFSGKTSENIKMPEIDQGEYVRTIFEGDKNSATVTKNSGWSLEDVED